MTRDDTPRPALVCPECGETARSAPPRTWNPTWGPRPEYSHTDGKPLCPVVGPDGYHPAAAILVTTGPARRGRSSSAAPHGASPVVPAVTLPVLACLPNTATDVPHDNSKLLALILQVVVGHAPDFAVYRIGGRYAGLLRCRPALPAQTHLLVINPRALRRRRSCDGGSISSLEPPPAHTPGGDLIHVVTPDGRWHGTQPWPGATEADAADPAPVTHLDRLPWWTVVVLLEMAAPLPGRDD